LELAKKVRRPKKKLGLPNQVNFHSLRNTFATLMEMEVFSGVTSII